MGSDIIYVTPCCWVEEYFCINEYECVCERCGKTFHESQLVEELVDYEDEE